MTITLDQLGNATPNYLRINKSRNKSPVYIVSFGAITGPLGTNYQPLPDEYCTGRVQNPTKARKALLSFPSGYSSEFNAVTYQSTLGAITFDIQDNNPMYPGEATRLITNYIIKNRWVTIKRGFQRLDESDYAPIYSGQINNVKDNSSKTGYTFEVCDPRKQMISTILGGHSGLVNKFTWVQSTNTGDNLFNVSDSTQFAGKTDTGVSFNGTPLGKRNYLRIGDNLFSYTGLINSSDLTDKSAVWNWVSAGGPTGPITGHPQWKNGTYYNYNDSVYSNGEYYQQRAVGGTGEVAPYGSGTFAADSLLWAWQGYGNSVYVQWQPNTNIVVGNRCANMGNRYICTHAGVTGPLGGPFGDGSFVTLAGGRFTGIALATPADVDNNGNPLGQTYDAGTNVDNFIKFDGHPIDLILQILLSTGSAGSDAATMNGGTNYSGTGINYDVLPLSQGIGISYAQVNIANFQLQKSLMGAMDFHGWFTDEEQALKFIENYILAQAHLMMYVNRNGQIDIRAILSTQDMAGAVTLDHTNIVGDPEFDNTLQTGGYFYNQIYLSFDYKPVADYFATIYIPNDNDSFQAYQEISQIPLECKFFDSNYGGETLATNCADTYLARFKQPPPVIAVKTFDALTMLDPGAPVVLDHPNVPNYQTGKRGGPINCQVISVDPEWNTGAMNIKLLALGWYS